MKTKCELWKGYIDKAGYGRDGRFMAHRIAYQASNGPIRKGIEVHHLCGTRACVKPGHLEAVTRSVHIRQHNSDRELSEQEIWEIKGQYARCTSGVNKLLRELAHDFDVSVGLIFRTIYRTLPYSTRKESWKKYLNKGNKPPTTQ